MGFFERIEAGGHEEVVLVADAAVGLRAIIAIHSTALGPSLGGVRFWHYPTEDDALADVLALSEAMTLKAAAAGLDQGGGKAVVMWDDPHAPRPEPFLRSLGRAIHQLGGRYLAAEDVGATQADMDGLALETPWVTGVDPASGGSGDPSPVTALGVLHGMHAACAEAFGDRTLAGRRVVVQGAGHVGEHLVNLLTGAGASVAVADIDGEKAARLGATHAVDVVEPAAVLEEPCDVLSPCALGGTLTPDRVDRLRCSVVCGAANNQLAVPEVDDALAARGIVYAPDFVVNAGGIINIAEEFTGYSPERAGARAAAIEATTAGIFDRARAWHLAPGRAAARVARERIAREGAGRRWMPGDPAAWTEGAPLTRLRPGRS